jgi:hypothetical protein
VQADLDRFLALVRRELGAEDAHLIEAGSEPQADPLVLSCRMPDGRGVVVRFAEPPADAAPKQRRLEMLAGTFDVVIEDAEHEPRSRPSITISLHDELTAVSMRSGAVNAIVIDAHSPVVWGAAHPQGVVAQPPLASSPRMAEAPANDDGEHAMAAISRRAVREAKALPELDALRKGKHIRHVERETQTPFVAHSFASIYLLVLAFDGPFDEVRAERALLESLPRIERLVLALPPLDPDPFLGVGAMAMRRPRRS